MSEDNIAPETSDEVPPETTNSEEVPSGPTHDPFSFKLLSTVQAQQSSNGLRHNDHMRYRQYCTRRLRRLYNVLRFKHGRGRFKHVPFPDNFNDMRFLEIPLVNAERSWSYGVQLKADNAAASAMNPRWRHHSIQRFAKAVKWAQKLQSICKEHADQRTQLEAEAYASFLEGTLLMEKEEWSEALAKFIRCRRLCEHLGLASEQAEGALFKAKSQELAPLIRECKYSLGADYDGDDDGLDDDSATKGARTDLSELNYRGQGLAISSDKIKGKLLRCLQSVSAIKVGVAEESSAVIEKYGELSAEFGDALKDIHTDMITAGADGQSTEWLILEAFAREHSISMNLERNLVLLWNHFVKLDGLEEISSSEARKVCRPEEGMRFCDLLMEDIGSLRELPKTTENISDTLTAYSTLFRNCRCFFLALCHTSSGKSLEAAALMDMLHARIDDSETIKQLPEPLGRLHPLVDRVHQGMPSRVAQWRCLGLIQLCTEAAKSKGKDEEVVPPRAPLEELSTLGAFPPAFKDIPCKPLLFDLAFPLIEPPDLDELMPKNPVEQKGFLGRVAGGLGSRLGGFLGRK